MMAAAELGQNTVAQGNCPLYPQQKVICKYCIIIVVCFPCDPASRYNSFHVLLSLLFIRAYVVIRCVTGALILIIRPMLLIHRSR